MKFHLIGMETKIELDVLGRSHPHSTDFWDGNWVTTNYEIGIPGYTVSFLGNLRTDEISDFSNDLKSMNQHLRGKAVLSNMDNFLHIVGKMDVLGKITWAVETCYPAGYGATLKFEFEADQSYLMTLIRELDNILKNFPVIGKPWKSVMKGPTLVLCWSINSSSSPLSRSSIYSISSSLTSSNVSSISSPLTLLPGSFTEIGRPRKERSHCQIGIVNRSMSPFSSEIPIEIEDWYPGKK
jgi:hypothetical protein